MVFPKVAIIAGAAALIAGGAIGYGAGIVQERYAGGNRGWGWQDDGRGMGMMNRDRVLDRRGDGYGQGYGSGNGSRQGGWEGRGGSGMGGGMNRGDCVADGCLSVDGLDYPAGNLSDAAKEALRSALDDEYKAHATYEQVISTLGATRPFIMIVRSEEQHIATLKALFDKYGIAIPANPYSGTIAAPASREAACATGVAAETANVALYRDKLLPAVKEYADLTAVFTNLMNASQNRHLPAFEQCN